MSRLLSESLSYEAALDYLFADASFGNRPLKYANPERGLERMREVLALLDNPHTRYPLLHITGTKGKGSTSAYSESILRHLGYRTGLFTSPHLHSFRERMRVDGQLMGRDEMADLMTRLRPVFERVPDLSIFDKITVLAFQYFAEKQVDWAVIEVGLGGRLDSTNVIQPAVCGISRISKDHMHILGDSLKQIAFEKAGIIKPRVPVFVAPQHPSAMEVLTRTAAERDAALHRVEPLAGRQIPLVGRHQQINAAIAWGMVQNAAERGLLEFDEARATTGLAATRWPGRFETLPTAESMPPLLVDCAHNVDSINMLLHTLQRFRPQESITFLFGANRDKLMGPMVERLAAVSPRLVLVQSQHPKALPTQAILQELQPIIDARAESSSPLQVESAASMAEGIQLAARLTPAQGLMVGTGSVFVVADLREAWHQLHPGLFPADDWVHEAANEPILMTPVAGKQG